ncbi:MAG: hypothetical protein L3K17_00375 [Thermoplasmata archaeon]|nr:hypothetical protein [Thermoplasmata archaeon]
MLAETVRLEAAPRSRRPSPSAPSPGGILFGMASPALPALENQWPSWLTPLGGGWKPSSPRTTSPRRSD